MHNIVQNFFNLHVLHESATLLRLGIISTVVLAFTAFALSLVVGGFVSAGRLHGSRTVRSVATAYTDLVRATPPLVSLTIVYYVLPAFGGPSLTNFQAGVLTFGLIQGAYVGEIYRGGLISLDKGQREAAMSLGLSPLQTGRLIVIPQVVRVVTPPLTSQLTQIFRDTPLVFVIGYQDLLTRSRESVALTSNATPLIAVACIYLIILLVLQGISAWLERRSEARLTARERTAGRRLRRLGGPLGNQGT